ncbi:TPA: hypothetical protein ACGXMH_001321 [Bacillus mobilis]|uniref:hypothetical protein n=1 Tax=Bacillus mobilis TaxID=2026190 RepID=UPI0011A1F9D2|nr:hypothetical protein [Bacillus mobilis]MED4384981.1 hypothetical protein [Bacillus mobilis]HDX9638996.1 hypothetical protein [Bacillus mobilis]
MKKTVYINSLEASHIYSHMVRGFDIEDNYVGMIPFSLELMKLEEVGMNIQQFTKTNKKLFSEDIINVKFTYSVSSADELLIVVNEKLKVNENELDNKNAELKKIMNLNTKNGKKLIAEIERLNVYNEKLNLFLDKINENKDNWLKVQKDKLREELYINGFTISHVDKKTGEIIPKKYIVYKRSSSKSRTGQVLFIKESLYEEMINWSRMRLMFPVNEKIDYASLLAYESLVGSSLEGTLKISPKNMLIVDDIESKFNKVANVVQINNDGELESVVRDAEIVNSLFDGESLLEAKYFGEGKSMKLLRNHMFKSAAFSTNIQLFLRDQHKKMNIKEPYDEWAVKNMFGEPMLAKDIEFIFTPTSLKALKFSHIFKNEKTNKQEAQKKMFDHWKEIVEKEDNIFGVCKQEKESKQGYDERGNILQQMSYQMINCLPASEEDIENLTIFEKGYIEKLKNDDQFFIEFIRKNANLMNSNEMFAEVYERNNSFINTKIFRDFRKAEINKYVTRMKRGKIRLNGDYAVMLGNPLEFLYHSIGEFNVNNHKLALKGNEIYTKLFDFDKELVGFRNPNTSPSNVLVAKNTYNGEIEKYFNLTKNIVCVNAVGFEIQDLLSGCDYDSDTIALFDSETLLELAKRCFGEYRVCLNNISSKKNTYYLNNAEMFVIDNQLADSQKNIGQIVNLGQWCMSAYWDELVHGNVKVADKLLKQVDVMTVLSGIAIDMAKKFYDIDIPSEVNKIRNCDELKKCDIKKETCKVRKKPNFFKYIDEDKKIYELYKCPMDYLFNDMKNLERAAQRENIDFEELLKVLDKKKANRKQEEDIINLITGMNEKIRSVVANASLKDNEQNRKITMIVTNSYAKLEKKTVKETTMYDLLSKLGNNKEINRRLLNALYVTKRNVFLGAFKKSQNKNKTKKSN